MKKHDDGVYLTREEYLELLGPRYNSYNSYIANSAVYFAGGFSDVYRHTLVGSAGVRFSAEEQIASREQGWRRHRGMTQVPVDPREFTVVNCPSPVPPDDMLIGPSNPVQVDVKPASWFESFKTEPDFSGGGGEFGGAGASGSWKPEE